MGMNSLKILQTCAMMVVSNAMDQKPPTPSNPENVNMDDPDLLNFNLSDEEDAAQEVVQQNQIAAPQGPQGENQNGNGLQLNQNGNGQGQGGFTNILDFLTKKKDGNNERRRKI